MEKTYENELAFVGIRFCQVGSRLCCYFSKLKFSSILGVQQHALPEGRQGEQTPAVCLQKLRLQDGGRQLLHLRQQNYARNRVSVIDVAVIVFW